MQGNITTESSVAVSNGPFLPEAYGEILGIEGVSLIAGREGGSSGGRGGRSFSGNYSGEARIEGSKPSFEGRPDGGRGRGEGRGRGRNSN